MLDGKMDDHNKASWSEVVTGIVGFPFYVNPFVDGILDKNPSLVTKLVADADEQAATLCAVQGLVEPSETELIYKFCLHRVFETLLFAAKHHHYGRNNIARSKVPGIVTRLGDKISRLERFVDGSQSAENICETLDDTSVYPTIAKLVQLGTW
jgi:hypothetical protein